jgi:uncharacterized protein YeaC (DUF1315 family)
VNYEDAVKQITPELYATFKRSLEIGRWPDGRAMTAEQKEHCLQAVIAYDALHTPAGERVGHIERDQGACASKDVPDTLRWADGDKHE